MCKRICKCETDAYIYMGNVKLISQYVLQKNICRKDIVFPNGNKIK